ncbi:MAG: hypothetical protein ABSF81_17930 [Bacteroidales bacterium]|jgi:hypothetical protein
MKYSRQETIVKLNIELATIEKLYKSNCINWKGTTIDSNEQYSEVIAQELLKKLAEFSNIHPVTRKSHYYIEKHGYIKIDICKSNRDEENFAKRITGLNFKHFGLIIDYQIPLKDSLKDTGIGKIDLISFDEKTKTLYLMELKYIGNKETLLRALLESYTYYKVVDKVELINDCVKSQKIILNKSSNSITSNDITIIPSVLLVPECNSYDELKEMESGDRPYLKELSIALGVKFFTIEFLINAVQL